MRVADRPEPRARALSTPVETGRSRRLQRWENVSMAIRDTGSVRALALVGPTSAGKTALMEALLEAATGQAVRPGEVGDSSPEARARGHSVELNLAGFEFMGDRYVVVDCPG